MMILLRRDVTESDGLVMNRSLFESLAPTENMPKMGHFIIYGVRTNFVVFLKNINSYTIDSDLC